MAADRKANKEEMKADIKAWREKIAAEMEAIKARTRAIRENMGTSHKEMVAVIKPRRNVETIACQEMEAHPEEEKPASVDMKPEVAEQQEEVPVEDTTVISVGEPEEETTSNTRKETMACQEMEERLKEEEPTSVDRKPEAAKEEVPKEDDVVKPVSGRKRRHRGKKQAAGRREEPKELTRGICGSRMKLAAACRKVSHRATVARRRRDAFKNERTQDGCQRRLAAARRGTSHRAEVVRKMIFQQADKKMPHRATVAQRMRDIFRPNTTRHAEVVLRKGIARKNWITDSILRGTVTEQTSGRRRQPQQKCNEGMRNQVVEELLRNCGLWRNSTLLRYQRPPEHQTMDWTLWRCQPPPKRKKKNGLCWRNW
jgi:hypothetical protein